MDKQHHNVGNANPFHSCFQPLILESEFYVKFSELWAWTIEKNYQSNTLEIIILLILKIN